MSLKIHAVNPQWLREEVIMISAVKLSTELSPRFSLETIKKEAYNLICRGLLDRQQPIYSLCQFIPAREWPEVECELERNDYLLRDHLVDLIAQLECWPSE